MAEKNIARSGRPLSADRESGYGSDNEILHTVRSLERLNLEDDGTRDWHKESVTYLDKNYGCWKELKETIMVPDSLQTDPLKSTTGEQREKQIFGLLKEFGEKHKEPMFVVHSHNFSELITKLNGNNETTKTWVQGEHDFVIIHREYGVIFLEVKSRAKTRAVYTKAKEQISKARFAVLSYVNKRFPKIKAAINDTFNYPGFVVMPNCKKPKSQPHDDVAYEEDCSSCESFKNWWQENITAPSKKINQELYEELVVRFVPFACLLPTLHQNIDKIHDNIVKVLTPRQLKSWYNSSPKQWITGPAGSGKTVLLIEKVKEILSKMKEEEKIEKILVLCFNNPLSFHLENEINGWFKSKYETNVSPVTSKTYDSFIKEVGGYDTIKDDQNKEKEFENRRKWFEATYSGTEFTQPPEDQMYEHIFVDEGQDLPRDKWPECLKKFHNEPDPRRKYYFWVMFDSNQHVQLTSTDNLPWKYLRDASELKDVLRNSRNIFQLSKRFYEGISEKEITLGHNEVGLDVHWEESLMKDRSNCTEIVANHIQNLLRKKVQRKDIAVLARTRKAANFLTQNLNECFKIRGIEADERLKKGGNSIAVDSIRRFKGLETKVAILCDPKCYPNDRIDKTRQLLYTAVSRCFCYLIIVSTPDGCRRIKNAETHIRYSSGSGSEKRESESSIEDYQNLENKHKKQERYSTFTPYGKRSRDNNYESEDYQDLENKHKKQERYSTLTPYGKKTRDNYESGPPERKEYVDKTDRDDGDDETIQSAVKINPLEEKRMQRDYERNKKSNQSRPLHVKGSDILEPGDEFIKDGIRSNVFKLLHSVVKDNLSFTGNCSFTDEDVRRCVAFIEYKAYQTHRTKHNSSPYTKALRTLKREITADNNKRVLNSEVDKALTQMQTES